MATLKQLKTSCDALGVELEVQRGGLAPSVEMYTRPGFVFSANGCHCSIHAYPGRGFPIAELYQSALEDLSAGLEPCVNIDCDVCDEGIE